MRGPTEGSALGPRRIGYLFIVAAIAIVLAGVSAASANVIPEGSRASAANGGWWPTAGHDIGTVYAYTLPRGR